MRNNTLLVILLLCSVCLNIYLWYDKDKEDIECEVTPGFQAPEIITPEQARLFANEYRESLNGNEGTLGGIISRSAFDQILCTPECNAITYMLAIDSSGETGPPENGVFVIFSGVNVEYDADSHTVINVTNLNIDNYITKLWCPPTCNNN